MCEIHIPDLQILVFVTADKVFLLLSGQCKLLVSLCTLCQKTVLANRFAVDPIFCKGLFFASMTHDADSFTHEYGKASAYIVQLLCADLLDGDGLVDFFVFAHNKISLKGCCHYIRLKKHSIIPDRDIFSETNREAFFCMVVSAASEICIPTPDF